LSTARALSPAIRAAAEGGEIRLVFAIGPKFDEIEPMRCGEGTKAGLTFGLGHHSARKRCPLATDVQWIIKAFHCSPEWRRAR
jgi:hypothetical protein